MEFRAFTGGRFILYAASYGRLSDLRLSRTLIGRYDCDPRLYRHRWPPGLNGARHLRKRPSAARVGENGEKMDEEDEEDEKGCAATAPRCGSLVSLAGLPWIHRGGDMIYVNTVVL